MGIRHWIGLKAAALVLLAVAAVHAAAPEDGNLFLWRVQSQATTVHLLGSIHVAKPELYPLDPAIERAFSQSTALVVEVDVESIDEQELLQIMLEKGRYPEGETLEDHLSARRIERLQRYLDERGMSFDSLKTTRPWLVAVMLTGIELLRLGYQADQGIDKHFLDQAKDSNKPVLELESASFQIDLFSDFSPEMEALLLEYQVEEVRGIAEQADEITRAWRSGDDAAIETIFGSLAEGDSSFAPLLKIMLDDRNVTMAEKIRGYLQDSERTCFVVVGAGHLVGDQGLVALLARDRTLRIEQVAATASEPAGND